MSTTLQFKKEEKNKIWINGNLFIPDESELP